MAIDASFLQAIAEQAKKHNCYIVISVTLRRELSQEPHSDKKNVPASSNISVTSCLFSPQGELVHQVDKQKLTEHERKFFNCSNKLLKVTQTPIGQLGLLTGCDDMNFEASRELALGGA